MSSEDNSQLSLKLSELFEKKDITYFADILQAKIQSLEKPEDFEYEGIFARLVLDSKKRLATVYKKSQQHSQEEPIKLDLVEFFRITQDLHKKNVMVRDGLSKSSSP